VREGTRQNTDCHQPLNRCTRREDAHGRKDHKEQNRVTDGFADAHLSKPHAIDPLRRAVSIEEGPDPGDPKDPERAKDENPFARMPIVKLAPAREDKRKEERQSGILVTAGHKCRRLLSLDVLYDNRRSSSRGSRWSRSVEDNVRGCSRL
jgi:hypothetical protein